MSKHWGKGKGRTAEDTQANAEQLQPDKVGKALGEQTKLAVLRSELENEISYCQPVVQRALTLIVQILDDLDRRG